MVEFTDAMKIAASGMHAQASRLRHVSENIANTDTPGYRRKTVSFEAMVEAGRRTGEVTTGAVRLDRTELPRVYDPSHPMADDTGHFDGSNVNLLIEITDAREAQRTYEANLKMFEQIRQMSSAINDLMRR